MRHRYSTLLFVLFLLLSKPAIGVGSIVSLFEKEVQINLGNQFDDKPVKHTFHIYNSRLTDISKLSVEPSCACTTVNISSDKIIAGKTAQINVVIDTTGKRGKIAKTLSIKYIYNNKPYEMDYVITFTVSARVKSHESRNLQDKIFGIKCGKCHSDPAEDKLGEDLFKAVCGFCHGMNAEGASAKSFNRLNYLRSFNPEKTREIISAGTETGLMPGFSQKHKGPLSEKQIESLVQYIASKREKWKKLL